MNYIFLNYVIWLALTVIGGLLGILIWEFLVRFKNGCKEIAEDMKKHDGLKLMGSGILIAILAVIIVPLSDLLVGEAFELFPKLLNAFVWCSVGLGVIATCQFIVGMVKYISSIRHGY